MNTGVNEKRRTYNLKNAPVFFVLNELESGWSWQDFELNGVEFDYCTTALDIPEEYIRDVRYNDDTIELTLQDVEEICNEDWYIQLIRKSQYYDENT